MLNILAACWFGGSSVIAVEADYGYDLRLNNTLMDMHLEQQCLMHLPDVDLIITWTPRKGTDPDDIDVRVPLGWTTDKPHGTYKDNGGIQHIAVMPVGMS